MDARKSPSLTEEEDWEGSLHLERSLPHKFVEGGEVDHGSPASRSLFHQLKETVEAGIRIVHSLQGSFGNHVLDLLTEGEGFWRVGGGYVGKGTGDLARGGYGNHAGGQKPPRVPLLPPAIVSSVALGIPPTRDAAAARSGWALGRAFSLPIVVAGTAGGLAKRLLTFTGLIRFASGRGGWGGAMTWRLLLPGD